MEGSEWVSQIPPWVGWALSAIGGGGLYRLGDWWIARRREQREERTSYQDVHSALLRDFNTLRETAMQAIEERVRCEMVAALYEAELVRQGIPVPQQMPTVPTEDPE